MYAEPVADEVIAVSSRSLSLTLEMVAKGRNSQLGSMLIVAFLHLKKKMNQPVVAQTVMGLAALLKEPLVQAHVLGRTVDRPFAPPQPPWLKALQAQQEEARAAAAAAAEEEDDEAGEEDDEDDEVEDDDEDEDEPEDDDGDDSEGEDE